MTDQRPSLTEVFEDLGGRVQSARGSWAKASCVLHEDRNPSASVNEDTGKWNCFSCNNHGDVFDLIGLYYKCDYKESLERASRYEASDTTPQKYSSGLLKKPNKKREGRKNWRPAWKDL